MEDKSQFQLGTGLLQENGKSKELNFNKTRRRHRRKIESFSENIFLHIKFYIRPILKPEFGFVIRQKKALSSVRKINLYQYIPTGCKVYTFTTNMEKMPHAKPLPPIIPENFPPRTRTPKGVENKIPQQAKKTREFAATKRNCVPLKPPLMSSRTGSNAKSKLVTPAKPPKTAQGPPQLKKEMFGAHITRKEALAGIESGSLLQGTIRINPNNYNNAFCANMDRTQADYYINGLANRNGALEGDVVVFRVLPESEWGDRMNVSTVVHILERVHQRIAVGFVTALYKNKRATPVFTPRDKRFPRLNITSGLPKNFVREHKKYESTLFLARLETWDNPQYGRGCIVEMLGESGDLKTETRSILLENDIKYAFPPAALEFLPDCYELSEAEIASRLDLRNECVFTIDPLTAKDLDDALHIKPLPNGNFEVGVHIADVSYYLDEDTLFDDFVAQRATSTYLVDKVYHMLPEDMCMACSLLPGKDSPTFSVIWQMTPEGEIVEKKFARTVINNAVQLTYEHAQWMIMNPDVTSWQIDVPKIRGFAAEDIRERVLMLYRIAQQMRKRRYDNGALQISQTKLSFTLDALGVPVKYYQQEIREANNLIEEFMLQANISVAEKIYHVFHNLAFLRRHDEANPRMINYVREKLEMIGIHVNIESSGGIHQSIQNFKALGPQEYPKFVALNHLLAKPMVRAQYFCADGWEYGDFHHYALSTPIYTHFTSPIRRYADVVVHRLLAAAIGVREPPTWTAEKLSSVAAVCNNMKYKAKKAGEASCQLMLATYIDCHQPHIVEAVVVNVAKKCFEVVVLATGLVVRIFTEDIKNAAIDLETVLGPEDVEMNKLTIHYQDEPNEPACSLTIDLFKVVHVSLVKQPKSIQLKGHLVRPSCFV